MADERKSSLAEAHLAFAKRLHGEGWTLLDGPSRTPADDERMLYAAYASCYHWLRAGTPLHQQRGEWLIARVHTVLCDAAPALAHARRCLELAQQHPELMEDFDLPFAHECVARARALAGDREEARRHLALAREGGAAIGEKEDREVFFESLRGGEWHGVA